MLPKVPVGTQTTQQVQVPIDTWTGADPGLTMMRAVPTGTGQTGLGSSGMVGTGLDAAALEELARRYGVTPAVRR